MKKRTLINGLVALSLILLWTTAFAAYHHEGEADSGKFLSAYPAKVGTKLDNCSLCHGGGNDGRSDLGSCQWCHYAYGYDGAGDVATTINGFGAAYKAAGRNAAAVVAINDDDSDGDGYSNAVEIAANTYPGDSTDYPGLVTAPFRIYTRDQLEALGAHTQFLLMNTSRSGDSYAEYTGVPMKDLLDDAGISESATGIRVYAPDGWGQTHPLNFVEDASSEYLYHVYGNMPGQTYQYPPATYFYDPDADVDLNPTYGWCEYRSPSCASRSHGDSISVAGGLKAILAYKHDGAYLDPGVLSSENKLDGEGPFRVVVPQKYVGPPDQSSRSDNQEVIWPYDFLADHNAGSSSRSATIIRVEPLPEGTTDINILEAGWSFVDQKKIIIYGAIDGTDSNGNGILDSEEGSSTTDDMDEDGVADYMDSDTAAVRPPTGLELVRMHTSDGNFSNVACIQDDDPSLPQGAKPALDFPYGVNRFLVTGLQAGGTVTVTLQYPQNVPTTAKYFKVSATGGWAEVPFGSNDGDKVITLTLTDGDPTTDADGVENGTIDDPGALAIDPSAASSSGGGSSGCFIWSLFK